MSERKNISNKIENFVDYFIKEQKIDLGDNPYKCAVLKAYDDVKRTMSGIGKMESQKKAALDNISKKIKNYFSNVAPTSKGEFDNIHNRLCQVWIEGFKQDENLACYGKAQKIVNMTFKYLYCVMKKDKAEYFKFCHMPLDSYTLSFLKEIQDQKVISYETKWSNIKDIDEYKKIQEIADKWADKNQLTALESEFIIWNCLKVFKTSKEYFHLVSGFEQEMASIFKIDDFSSEYFKENKLQNYIEKVLNN